MIKERHILGISGGKDSAALAIHMARTRPELNIEYFFTDTGEELPEVYSYLSKLTMAIIVFEDGFKPFNVGIFFYQYIIKANRNNAFFVFRWV